MAPQVAVLCPGPSLRFHENFEGKVIAVTDAILTTRTKASFWAFAEEPHTQGRVKRYKPYREWHQASPIASPGHAKWWREHWDLEPVTPAKELYGRLVEPCSLFLALKMACHVLRASEIVLYGVDHEGSNNHHPMTGSPLPGHFERPDDRWEKEREVITWLQEETPAPPIRHAEVPSRAH